MQIHISGKQLDLSDALRERVISHLNAAVDKYFDSAIEATVTFSKERSFFMCDINVHAGRGLLLRGEGEGSDANTAFDDAAEHITKRLRRYNRRMNDHTRKTALKHQPEIGKRYVLQKPGTQAPASPAPSSDSQLNADLTTIIEEHPTEIAALTIQEAVMRLDLADQTLLMFRNITSRQINIIYRRTDGHIGWIDPVGEEKSE